MERVIIYHSFLKKDFPWKCSVEHIYMYLNSHLKSELQRDDNLLGLFTLSRPVHAHFIFHQGAIEGCLVKFCFSYNIQ